MTVNTLVLLEKKLDEQILKFLEQIEDNNREGFERDKERERKYTSGFPILDIASKEYYKSKYQEEILEWRVRDELVNEIFDYLFKLHGYDIRWRLGTCATLTGGRKNEEYEKAVPVEFFIVIDGKYIAYRYTLFEQDYSIKMNLPAKFDTMDYGIGVKKINRWYCIDWTGLASEEIELKNKKYNSNNYQRIISLENFFDEYFSKDEYYLFVSKLKRAVACANEILGFQTIPKIVSNNLYVFKKNFINELSNIEKLTYKFVTAKGDISSKEISIIYEEVDLKKLNQRFDINNRKLALIGTEKFAKSFVTSEYLYDIFQKDASLDYTSIVLGYIKSVEQLCETIVWKLIPKLGLNLYYPARWLEKKEKTRLKNKGELKTNCKPFMVLMKEGNQQFFNQESTMRTMFDFFSDNKDILFDIQSEITKNQITECLNNYVSFDRNGYLHKHNIDDFIVAERIKNNTKLIYYWLLGAIKMKGEADLLGITDDSFDCLYRKIAYRYQWKYLVDFGDGVRRKVVKVLENPQFDFDEYGNLNGAKLSFIEVDDYPENNIKYRELMEVALMKFDKIEFHKDSLPKEMWRVDQHGNKIKIFDKM